MKPLCTTQYCKFANKNNNIRHNKTPLCNTVRILPNHKQPHPVNDQRMKLDCVTDFS